MSPCGLMMTATLDKEIEMHGPLHTAPSVLIFRKIPSLFVGWILRNTAPRKQVDHVPEPPAGLESKCRRLSRPCPHPQRLPSLEVSFESHDRETLTPPHSPWTPTRQRQHRPLLQSPAASAYSKYSAIRCRSQTKAASTGLG